MQTQSLLPSVRASISPSAFIPEIYERASPQACHCTQRCPVITSWYTRESVLLRMCAITMQMVRFNPLNCAYKRTNAASLSNSGWYFWKAAVGVMALPVTSLTHTQPVALLGRFFICFGFHSHFRLCNLVFPELISNRTELCLCTCSLQVIRTLIHRKPCKMKQRASQHKNTKPIMISYTVMVLDTADVTVYMHPLISL